jgi:hypothetical protein
MHIDLLGPCIMQNNCLCIFWLGQNQFLTNNMHYHILCIVMLLGSVWQQKTGFKNWDSTVISKNLNWDLSLWHGVTNTSHNVTMTYYNRRILASQRQSRPHQLSCCTQSRGWGWLQLQEYYLEGRCSSYGGLYWERWSEDCKCMQEQVGSSTCCWYLFPCCTNLDIQLKETYVVVSLLKEQSGFKWDELSGASITIESESVWTAFVKVCHLICTIQAIH